MHAPTTRVPEVRVPVVAGLAVRIVAALAVILAGGELTPVAADEALWSLLAGGGQVVMMRHASTVSGIGDPPRFDLRECATQRNLSERGRIESRRVAVAFRARRIPVGRVLSSEWCRCSETARLAFGRAELWPALNSYFNDPARDRAQTPAVRALASEPPGSGNLIMVTHQVNVRAVTGIAPAPGEMVVLTPHGDGRFTVAGRLPPAAFTLR
jgi:phosphohistidine phosphatase SixA